MTNRSDLTRMIRQASTGDEIARAVAALDDFDQRQATLAATDRDTDLGAVIAAQRLTPFTAHEHHTAATDWLGGYEPEQELDFRTAMIAEASTWYQGLSPAVRADRSELAAQASGRARTLASAYAQHGAAEGGLAGSGLPDQAERLAPGDGQGHAVQHLDGGLRSAAAGILHDDLVEFEQWLRHRVHRVPSVTWSWPEAESAARGSTPSSVESSSIRV